MADRRQPMTRAEFDAACAIMERRLSCSCTSGIRTKSRNAAVGGVETSKHLIGMARDYVVEGRDMLKKAAAQAKILGLWYQVYEEKQQIHVQGLPPGEVPMWWRKKYLED